MSNGGEQPIGPWLAAARMHQRLLTGIILYVLQKRGEAAASEMVFRLFRAQHAEKFLAGIEALGLGGLPDAVAAGQYIYLSNLSGGVSVQYIYESDRKAWVRYPPPRWIWEGAAICAVPRATSLAMARAFHAQCGVSLGNPRLGFVCTKVTTDGAPGLEGYFQEHDRDLAPNERLRLAPDEDGPDFDPAAAPRLDWPEDRQAKARRNYACLYIRSLLPEMFALFGEAEASAAAGHAARLIGMQHYHETAATSGVEGGGIEGFAAYLAAMLRGSGDDASWRRDGDSAVVRSAGWRLMAGKGAPPAAFDAWNGLWQGALAAHDRRLDLVLEGRMDAGDAAWLWRIRRPEGG